MFACSKSSFVKWTLLFAYSIVMGTIYKYYETLPPSFHPALLKENFLIDTKFYKLLNFSPFDDSVMSFIETPPSPLDCSRGQRPLTTGISSTNTSTFSPLQSVGTIILHKEHQSDYGVESFSCCYKSVFRDNRHQTDLGEQEKPDDHYFVEQTCHLMKNRITVVESEAVFVTCSSEEASVIYQNIHIFVKTVTENTAVRNVDQLNVLILGLDSVSRLNMHRYMPNTVKVLNKIGALKLLGYNKMFDNSYLNLITLLTGYLPNDPEIVKQIKSRQGFYDNVPFIWKNFSASGYELFYGEDCAPLGTFTLNRRGFQLSPTKHYIIPYLKASEELIGWKRSVFAISKCKICVGPKSTLDVLLGYAKEVSEIVTRPYFSFLWSSSLTHDRLSYTSLTDEPLSKFLQRMYNEDRWNKTIVFLLSDHGMRFGKIRQTYIGKIEENLPFNYILLPKWFKKTYPTAYKNLYHNQFRLTTPADVSETLKDILAQNYRENQIDQNTNFTPPRFKFSLFKKIPVERTCSAAKIPVSYCAGMLAMEVSPQTYQLMQGAQSITEYINNGLKKYPDCHPLTVLKINKAFLINFFDKDPSSNIKLFIIQITTTPGKAVLEGLIKSVTTKSGQYNFNVMGDISRLNSYEGQSNCITDIVFVKYCLCKGFRENLSL